VDGLDSSSNSFNGGFVKEHIEFRSSHLSEHSNNRSHGSGLVNFERGFGHLGSMFGELDEGSIFSYEIIKESESTTDNSKSISVVRNSSNVDGMTGSSLSSGDIKGSLGIDDILFGVININVCFLERRSTGS